MNINFNMEKLFFANTQQGFPFHSGGVGEGNFELMFAIVRNRPRRLEPVPLGTAARDSVWVFQRCIASWHLMCQTILWRGRRTTFATLSKNVLLGFVAGPTRWMPRMSFCVAGAALWTSWYNSLGRENHHTFQEICTFSPVEAVLTFKSVFPTVLPKSITSGAPSQRM